MSRLSTAPLRPHPRNHHTTRVLAAWVVMLLPGPAAAEQPDRASANRLESTTTVASQLAFHNTRSNSRQADQDQPHWQSQVTGEHRWHEWAAVWQVNHQHPLHTEQHAEWERTLSELSWNPVLSDQLVLRVGKFSQDIERTTVFQPLGFFQTPAAPFDSMASIEGMWMASLTWWTDEQPSAWLSNWVVTPIVARNAPSEFPATAAQRLPHRERSPHQWGLVLERDVNSLSTTLLMQQFQGQKPGVGLGYTWVPGAHWQFSGSGFLRQESRYMSAYRSAADALPASRVTVRHQETGIYPRLTQGLQWSGLAQAVTLELHYDRRKLTRQEQRALYDTTDRAHPLPTIAGAPDPTRRIHAVRQLSGAMTLLSQDRHQQRYLYADYRHETTTRQWRVTALVGADRSHWSQLAYTHYLTWSLSLWAEIDIFSGDDSTEFGRAPRRTIHRLGGQWVF